jgi:hypothetical protein
MNENKYDRLQKSISKIRKKYKGKIIFLESPIVGPSNKDIDGIIHIDYVSLIIPPYNY